MADAYHYDPATFSKSANAYPGSFVVQRHHLKEGLKAREIADYARCSIIVGHHDDFPHSEEVLFGHLPQDRYEQIIDRRAQMLEDTLSTHGFFESNTVTPSLYIAQRRASSVYIDFARAKLTSCTLPHEVPEDSPYQLVKAEAILHHSGATKRGFLSCTREMDIYGMSAEVLTNKEAMVLLPAHQQPPELFWSSLTNLPVHYLKRFPNPEPFKRFIAFHEMGHLGHFKPYLTTDPSHKFCEEVHVELFASNSMMQMSKFGLDVDKTLQMTSRLRHATFLFEDAAHRIAPAVDAYLASHEPPSYTQIQRAHQTIQSSVAKILSVNETQLVRSDPGDVFSAVRRGHNDGLFDPLSSEIAHRMLDAVETFSPDLTRSPTIVRPVYQVIDYQS